MSPPLPGRGAHGRELACLVQLGQLAWWSESSDQLAALVGQVFRLEAEGCPDAVPLACLGRALVIDLLNDSRGVLAELDRVLRRAR